MTARPLDGVRVLDLTRVIAGPHSTRMLADLDADIIVVLDGSGGEVRLPSVPWRFTDTTSTGPRHVVGPVGQDNDSVLRDLLGLDDDELDRLRTSAACASASPGEGSSPSGA